MNPVVISIISLVVAAASLGWNVSQFVLGGARPKAQLVNGAVVGSGMLIWPASMDSQRQLDDLESQGASPRAVVGVQVVNHGRAPMRVDKWIITGIGGVGTLMPLGQTIGPPMPHDLPAGASETWVVDLDYVVAQVGRVNSPTHALGVSVQTGTGKTLKSKRTFTVS